MISCFVLLTLCHQTCVDRLCKAPKSSRKDAIFWGQHLLHDLDAMQWGSATRAAEDHRPACRPVSGGAFASGSPAARGGDGFYPPKDGSYVRKGEVECSGWLPHPKNITFPQRKMISTGLFWSDQSTYWIPRVHETPVPEAQQMPRNWQDSTVGPVMRRGQQSKLRPGLLSSLKWKPKRKGVFKSYCCQFHHISSIGLPVHVVSIMSNRLGWYEGRNWLKLNQWLQPRFAICPGFKP